MSFEIGGVSRWHTAVDPALEVTVEVLIGIQFRRIGRQEEDLDMRRIALDPFGDFASLVDSEVVENQEDGALASPNQTLQETKQKPKLKPREMNHESPD